MNSTNIQHEQVPQETETIIESGAELRFIGFSGDRHIPMNVSKEADAEVYAPASKGRPEALCESHQEYDSSFRP